MAPRSTSCATSGTEQLPLRVFSTSCTCAVLLGLARTRTAASQVRDRRVLMSPQAVACANKYGDHLDLSLQGVRHVTCMIGSSLEVTWVCHTSTNHVCGGSRHMAGSDNLLHHALRDCQEPQIQCAQRQRLFDFEWRGAAAGGFPGGGLCCEDGHGNQ